MAVIRFLLSMQVLEIQVVTNVMSGKPIKISIKQNSKN